MLLYNTLSKAKEEFLPENPGKVGMYTCGPTVYDYIHIGNIRAYMFADLVRRYLVYCGYEVRMIKNITDVGHLTDDDVAQGDSGEDKMLRKAKKEKKDPYEIARFYENAAHEDEAELNILPAAYHPRATEHIEQMIAMIETLIAKGHAYEAGGNVFLDVTSYPEYGKLSGNTLDQLAVGARLSDPHPDKRSQWDFALWLAAGPEHLMRWESPWSVGYPGWHIECSAMSRTYLGDTFDIHTGGEDNIFPHHEAEIAQSECVTGAQFVRYWLHTRHLLVDGAKMSKSKGTGYTLADVKARGYSAMDLRMLYLMSHYRSQMNFTWESMAQAQKNRETIERCMERLARVAGQDAGTQIAIDTHRLAIERAMDDDLNTPESLKHLLALTTEINKALDAGSIANHDAVTAYYTRVVHDVFGLRFDLHGRESAIPDAIVALAQRRVVARRERDFATADALRDQIKDAGYTLTDDDSERGYEIAKSS